MGDCIEKGGITRPAAFLLLHLHYSFHGAIFINEKHNRVFSALNNFSVEVGNFTSVLVLFPNSWIPVKFKPDFSFLLPSRLDCYFHLV